jgi:hypothetical protein
VREEDIDRVERIATLRQRDPPRNHRRVERQTGTIARAMPTPGPGMRKLFSDANRRLDDDEKHPWRSETRAGMVDAGSSAAMLRLRQMVRQAGG